jgi:hypothetical protein
MKTLSTTEHGLKYSKQQGHLLRTPGVSAAAEARPVERRYTSIGLLRILKFRSYSPVDLFARR